MTPENKVIIREAALQWLAKGEGFTQTELANRVGTSVSYINKVVQNKYDEKYPSASVWHSLAKELEVKIQSSHWKHFETENYQKIQFRLGLAKADNGLLVIDGMTGAGKTYALEKYYRSQPAGCYYVKVHSEYSKQDLLKAILDSMGEKPNNSKSFDLMKAITEKLNKPNSMLILDETEYMKSALWHTVKAIIDNTKVGETRTCTIVLAGCGIQKKLTNLATGKTSEQGWQQLLRRLKGNFPQLSVMQADKNEWSKEVQFILNELNITDKHVITWFTLNCANYGELETFVRRIFKVSEDMNTPINIELIKAIFE
jgi:DNA transposition AAA+ family ATPase